MNKVKVQLVNALDEAKHVADEEGKERHTLLGKYKNLEHEIDGTKEHLSEESAAKQDVYRQLNKAAQEADMWRQKFETECLAKSEDLEMAKMKLQPRLTKLTFSTAQWRRRPSSLTGLCLNGRARSTA